MSLIHSRPQIADYLQAVATSVTKYFFLGPCLKCLKSNLRVPNLRVTVTHVFHLSFSPEISRPGDGSEPDIRIDLELIWAHRGCATLNLCLKEKSLNNIFTGASTSEGGSLLLILWTHFYYM